MLKVNLNAHQFLRVSGPDAKKFLQGQVSCNLDLLNKNLSMRGALCNLKGRVISDFRLLQQGDDCLLQAAEAMADIMKFTLAKYAVFSKAELSVDDSPQQVFGLWGDGAEEFLSKHFDKLPQSSNEVTALAGAKLIRVSASPRYELWIFDVAATLKLINGIEQLANAEIENWNRLEILDGIYHVDTASTEEYTPQLLNYDISGVVDFNKGCYTGQEIVARMHFRSQAKKRLVLSSSNQPIGADSVIQQSYCGKTISATILRFSNDNATNSNENLCLAILNVEATTESTELSESPSLSLSDRRDSLLKILPLPYNN